MISLCTQLKMASVGHDVIFMGNSSCHCFLAYHINSTLQLPVFVLPTQAGKPLNVSQQHGNFNELSLWQQNNN